MEKTSSLLSSLTTKAKGQHESAGNGGMKPTSFAFMFKDNTSKKTIHLSELRNDVCVSSVDVTIPSASVEELATKEGMEQVFENGPWLIQLVPIILNTWTLNTRLKKDDINTAPVWIKLYNVPIVAFLEVELSLITTKLGRPIMLDADSEEVENVFVEDKGKLVDGLVDDARKKVEAPPKKTPRKTAGNSSVNDSNPNSFIDPPNFSDYPPQPHFETYSCELCGNDSHHGYDCPPRFLFIKDYRNEKIDIHFRRECESMIDELKGKFNGMSIEINKKKELQRLEQVANLSTYPSQHFKYFCYDDDDDYDYEKSTIPLNEIDSQIPSFIAITPVLPTLEPEDSLIMGDEHLSTILEKESDEVIKSSVEDLVLILSEFEDTSESDSDCDLPSDDESLSDEDVPKDKVKIYSNPLFEFDDEYISSDVNPLFDEVLENIESKASYDSNLDEQDLLVTPLSDFNKDECFDPGSDVDEIEFLLYRDLSPPKISVASILEGFTDESPLEENDDLFDLESKANDWKKILYDAPIEDLMTEDKVFDPDIHKKKFSPTYVNYPLRIAIIFPSHMLSEFFFLISPIRWNLLLFISPPGVRISFLTLASLLFIFLL
ncbi:hypothetical protein Tco_0852776 [Tanacetum coccineum]